MSPTACQVSVNSEPPIVLMFELPQNYPSQASPVVAIRHCTAYFERPSFDGVMVSARYHLIEPTHVSMHQHASAAVTWLCFRVASDHAARGHAV